MFECIKYKFGVSDITLDSLILYYIVLYYTGYSGSRMVLKL